MMEGNPLDPSLYFDIRTLNTWFLVVQIFCYNLAGVLAVIIARAQNRAVMIGMDFVQCNFTTFFVIQHSYIYPPPLCVCSMDHTEFLLCIHATLERYEK